MPPLPGFCSAPGILLAVRLVWTGLLPESIKVFFFKALSQRNSQISEYSLLREAHCLSVTKQCTTYRLVALQHFVTKTSWLFLRRI